MDFIYHYQIYCGFDAIYLYINDIKTSYYEKLRNINVYIEYIDDAQLKKENKFQQQLYTNFMKQYSQKYDYIFFVDDDEFLWINKQKYKNINDFLSICQEKKNILSYGIPWKYISYKTDHHPYTRTDHFIKNCFYTLDNTTGTCIKSIVSTKIFEQDPNTYSCCHYWKNIKTWLDFKHYIINTHYLSDIKFINENHDLILYHYMVRTIEEWNRKLARVSPTQTTLTMKDEMLTYMLNEDSITNQIFKNYNKYINPFGYNHDNK